LEEEREEKLKGSRKQEAGRSRKREAGSRKREAGAESRKQEAGSSSLGYPTVATIFFVPSGCSFSTANFPLFILIRCELGFPTEHQF
jgi:hypothetical protein